jgi:hypothetical protein
MIYKDFSDFFNQNNFDNYQTTVNGTILYCTDKGGHNNYINRIYNNIFDIKNRFDKITLVEIGVFTGHSLKLWSDWFTNGNIIGIEINKNEGLSQSSGFSALNDMYNFNVIWEDAYVENTVDMFDDNSIDFLIEDGSHELEHQIFTVKKWLPKLKSGGILVIEDIKDYYDFNLFVNSVDRTLSDEFCIMKHIPIQEAPDSNLFKIIKK